MREVAVILDTLVRVSKVALDRLHVGVLRCDLVLVDLDRHRRIRAMIFVADAAAFAGLWVILVFSHSSFLRLLCRTRGGS